MSFVDCRGSFDGTDSCGVNDTVFMDNHSGHKVEIRLMAGTYVVYAYAEKDCFLLWGRFLP